MREWINGLEARERMFLQWGGVITVGMMVYLLIVEPLGHGVTQNEKRIAGQRQQIEKLDKIIAEYKAIGPVLNRKDKNKASILSIIDQTSSRLGLKASMKRLTPDGKDKVRIRMEQAGFDKVMSWLAMLSKEHQINTEALSLRPNEDDQGVVSGNLTLHRW